MGGNGVLPGKRDLTMNKTKMAWASAALALALLLPAAGVKAYSSENVSLPSPIVEYASYNKLREAVLNRSSCRVLQDTRRNISFS